MLTEFLNDVPQDVPLAFEFRIRGGFVDAVFEALEARGIALCLAESEKLVVPERITASFVYFRLRKESCTAEEVAEVQSKCAALAATGMCAETSGVVETPKTSSVGRAARRGRSASGSSRHRHFRSR